MMRPILHATLLIVGLVLGLAAMLATLTSSEAEPAPPTEPASTTPKRAPLPVEDPEENPQTPAPPAAAHAEPSEPAAATPGEAAADYVRDRLEADADVAVADTHVRDLGDGRREVTLTLERRAGAIVTRRVQYAVVVERADERGDAAGWEATIASDAFALSDREWARLERELQSRATSHVHETFFDDRADVKLHATALGRGQFEVIARARDLDGFSGYSSVFFHAVYDPLHRTWAVERTD